MSANMRFIGTNLRSRTVQKYRREVVLSMANKISIQQHVSNTTLPVHNSGMKPLNFRYSMIILSATEGLTAASTCHSIYTVHTPEKLLWHHWLHDGGARARSEPPAPLQAR